MWVSVLHDRRPMIQAAANKRGRVTAPPTTPAPVRHRSAYTKKPQRFRWGPPCGNGWKGSNQTNRSRHPKSPKILFAHHVFRIEPLFRIACHAVLQQRHENALLLVHVRGQLLDQLLRQRPELAPGRR